MPLIHLVTTINAPVQRCFDLSRSIDLHRLSLAHTGETAVAGVTSGLIGQGQSVTWQARHFGIRMRLTSLITHCEANKRFTDEMLRGPFKSLVHHHVFERRGNVTVMTDAFTYVSPLGLLGRMADRFFLESYLRKLLIERNDVVKRFAEGEEWQAILSS